MNSKTIQIILRSIDSEWNILAEDEYPYLYTMLWLEKECELQKGIRPVVTITSSRQKVFVVGTISMDGRQLFKQYDNFNEHTF